MPETISKLRTFFTSVPDVCGVPSALAQIEGVANGGRFDLEVTDPHSVFQRKPGQSTRQRLAPAFVAWEEFADEDELAYAIDLAVYAADCCELNKSGLEHPQSLIDQGDDLLSREANHPGISALFTVSEASTLSNWA